MQWILRIERKWLNTIKADANAVGVALLHGFPRCNRNGILLCWMFALVMKQVHPKRDGRFKNQRALCIIFLELKAMFQCFCFKFEQSMLSNHILVDLCKSFIHLHMCFESFSINSWFYNFFLFTRNNTVVLCNLSVNENKTRISLTEMPPIILAFVWCEVLRFCSAILGNFDLATVYSETPYLKWFTSFFNFVLPSNSLVSFVLFVKHEVTNWNIDLMTADQQKWYEIERKGA